MKHSNRAYDPLKRVLDVIAAAVGLAVLSPLLLVLAVLVRVKLGAPVVFKQQRPGKDGRLFTLYKFRTMRETSLRTSAEEAVASDAERLTSFGRRLRASSLDELPELVNVLAGTMSVVGPRPLLPEYLDRYNEEQARRHEVRPGITGWAQVNGRNALTWTERLAMDVWYVDNRSFALDARILARTLRAVLSADGVSGAGTETMQPFEGDTKTATREESQ